MTKAEREAIRVALVKRYHEQAIRWPLMRDKVPEDLYVKRNLHHAIRLKVTGQMIRDLSKGL